MDSCVGGGGPSQSERVASAQADVVAERRGHPEPHALLLLVRSPIALTRGPEHVIELANPACAQIFGGRPLVGLSAASAVPELVGQEILARMDEALASGALFVAPEMPIQLDRRAGGPRETGYFRVALQPTQGLTGAVEGLLVSVHEVTDQVLARQRAGALAATLEQEKRAQTEADAYVGRMARLQSLTAQLTGVMDAAEAGGVIVRDVTSVLDARGAMLYLLDEPARALRLLCSAGLEEWLTQRFAEIPVDSPTATAHAYRTGQPAVFRRPADYDRQFPENAGLVRAIGHETVVALPLRVEGRTLGVLSIVWPLEDAFGAVDLEFMRLAAQACAMTLERVRLFEAERAERARAEAAQRRLAVLARMGEILAASLDYERTIASVTELCVPLLSDWAAVDVLNDDGTFSRLAVAHVDPEKIRLAHEIWRKFPPHADEPKGMPRVVRTGEAEMFEDIPDDLLAQSIADPELLAFYRAIGLRSSIVVPLRVAGRPIGALSMVNTDSGRRFGPSDLQLAEEVARRASFAIERAHAFRELQEASRLKDEFLATVSHELRTPLTAIAGWTRMLLAGKLPPERTGHALEVVARNADLQTQLISDLLDVSRAITGKLRLDVREVDLLQVIGAAVESVGPMAAARGVALELDLSPASEGGPAIGDPDRLQQVAWNLLTNAIKFSPSGGRVRISLRREGAAFVFAVSDQGEGIRPDFLPFVFDRFRQADASTTRKHGGLGLGLSITRTLVEMHGGTVAVASEGPGTGSTFTVRLPVATRRSDALPRTPALTAPPPASAAEAPALAGARVLLVEDEPDTREMLFALFEQHGAQVRAASSAEEAFAAIPGFRPSAIVSDIGMPNEDGLSLIRRVRALPVEQGGAVPAAALTAFARDEDRAAALAAGFDAHVGKPVDPAALVALVARMLATDEARREGRQETRASAAS